jgi:FtsZ-interacting cell division protein ZipA
LVSQEASIMLETLSALLSWTLMDIVGAIVLLAILVYGVIWSGRRRKLGAARNAVRDDRTDALYGRDETASRVSRKDTSHAQALDARNTGSRETEDDMARASLGPRGEPGKPDSARMTPQRAKKTPKHLEPGHTS